MKQVKLYLSIYVNVHAILGFGFHPIDGISAISVCVNETINKSNFQSQYLGKTKRRIKTLHNCRFWNGFIVYTVPPSS